MTRSTLFVDISELAQRDSKTGIQRVVRSIVNALLTQGVDGYRFEFIYATIGEPYRYAHRYVQQLRGLVQPSVVDTIVDPQADRCTATNGVPLESGTRGRRDRCTAPNEQGRRKLRGA